MRKFVSLLLTVVLILSCVPVTVCAQEERTIPILLYHNISDYIPGQKYDASLNISAAEFERHMVTLLETGYTPITYSDYYAYMTEGAPLPDKPILITFDDGYLSNYLYAFPVLKKLNIKATIFVITDRRGKSLGTNPHFSWNQAREMVDSGIIDIQSHTHSHQVSTSLSDEELAYEMRISKRLIEMHTGKKCNVLAFPNGVGNEREKAAALSAGYKIVNMVGGGTNRYGDRMDSVRRITVFGNWSGFELLNQIKYHVR